MSPEAQRIAIGNACREFGAFRWSFRYWWSETSEPIACGGWKTQASAEYAAAELRAKGAETSGMHGQHITVDRLPDYLSDLNAMHEAEKVLSVEQRVEFVIRLNEIVRRGKPIGNGIFQWANVHATAAQRAEAFLRCLGLWTEGEDVGVGNLTNGGN